MKKRSAYEGQTTPNYVSLSVLHLTFFFRQPGKSVLNTSGAYRSTISEAIPLR